MVSQGRNHLVVISFCSLQVGIAGLSCGNARHLDDSKLDFAIPYASHTLTDRVFVDGEVSVENVSFSFDRKMIDRVEASEIAAEKLLDEDTKPDGIGARTLNFYLHYTNSVDRASIVVFKLSEYKDAFERLPHYLEHRDEDLIRLLSKSTSVKSWGIVEPIHVRWMDAHHDFYAKAQIIEFRGGRVQLMLTQIGQDAYNIINNRQLQYFFQGLTEDGVYFVEMTFPVRMEGLPDKGVSAYFERYNLPEDFSDAGSQKRHRNYRSRIAKEVNEAHDDRFKPTITHIRGFIESFSVKSP